MPLLDALNPVQRRAAEAIDGPVMIIAGAGSGKTRVLTYRTAHLLEQHVRPDSVLALTFTNKAAREMKERIEALVGPASRALWMGTFHSLFARMLRQECTRLGYDRSFTIYDSDDSLALVRSVMQDRGVSTQQYTPQSFRARISSAKNRLQTPAVIRAEVHDPSAERTAVVFEDYERRLRKANAMDFDDLLLRPLELFTRFPDVLERYQYRFSHLMVDEYQDTNRVQYRLINLLAAVHKNICVVGDDAQSIYAFRGADIRNILDFERDYPDCAVFRLEQNYRSTKTILALAQSIIARNVDQIRKELWTQNPDGEPVTLETCDDDRDEGYRVVAAIEDNVRRRRLGLKDVAVLYRTNAQSRSIEDALRRSGIPYVIVGGVAFYKRKEIKDVLAYVRAVVNPRDDESILRVINIPARGIGETSLGKIRALAATRGLPIIDTLVDASLQGALSERTLRSVREFHALIAKYQSLVATMSASELARSLIDEIGIARSLKEEGTPEALARRDNVLELVSALTEFADQRPGAGLPEFLEEVSLVSDVDTADFGRNAVTLMTLHAAKGLEFPVVCITGLEEGLFPISSAADERRELEEERRLFYVGITRAREKLYLLHAMKRYQYGALTYSPRSRFLDELDPEFLEVHGPRPSPAAAHGAVDSSAPRRSAGSAPRPHRRPDHPAPPHDPMPRYEDETQEIPSVNIGTLVVHDTFGRGRIVGLDGRGERMRAIVDFEVVGRKQLMLKFAHLRLL
jgi:DNA helicase-2/ATP-dependent DNA helicase PcrA